jgi:hypothetical protein
MVRLSVHYSFRQKFGVDADRAFRWCVDYEPADAQLDGSDDRRTVQWLTEDTVLLTDVSLRTGSRPVVQVKLVRIEAGQRKWTSTHLEGPGRFSQAWYRVVANPRGRSHLEFQGLHLEAVPRGRRTPPARVLARQMAREGAQAWQILAKAMMRDLSAP